MSSKRKEIVSDILRNEKRICLQLDNLIKGFIKPLKESAVSSNRPFISSEHIKEICGNVEKRVEEWTNSPSIGDILLPLSEEVHMAYSSYANTIVTSLDFLFKLKTESDLLLVFLQGCESKLKEIESFEQLLIAPIRYIPLFARLLEELKSETRMDESDFATVDLAQKKLSEFARSIEDKLKEVESQYKLVLIQRNLVFDAEADSKKGVILAPGRRWMKEGELTFKNPKKSHLHIYYCFLFNDIFLLTEQVPSNSQQQQQQSKFKFHKLKSLNTLKINEKKGGPTAFMLKDSKHRRKRIVTCSDEKTKREWLESLSFAISQYSNSRHSKSRASNLFQISKALSPKGEQKLEHVVSSPFNFSHKVHVDQALNWKGQDPLVAFSLEEKLGSGAYGTVWKAIHVASRSVVAAKIIEVQSEDDDAADRKLMIENEIAILKHCRNNHIVSYYGTVSKGDQIWILMDYCALGSVRNIMETIKHAFMEDEIAHICEHTLKGLLYLHTKSIIHRGNLLMSEEGNCLIGDFGVSTLHEAGVSEMIGTPLYMSPEVVLKRNYGVKADIWSLGICVIELAEGAPPWFKMNQKRAMKMIPIRSPPTLQEPKKWSADMNDFIAKCLVKDPEERSSAIDLLMHPFIRGSKGAAVMKKCIDEYLTQKKALLKNSSSSSDSTLNSLSSDRFKSSSPKVNATPPQTAAVYDTPPVTDATAVIESTTSSIANGDNSDGTTKLNAHSQFNESPLLRRVFSAPDAAKEKATQTPAVQHNNNNISKHLNIINFEHQIIPKQHDNSAKDTPAPEPATSRNNSSNAVHQSNESTSSIDDKKLEELRTTLLAAIQAVKQELHQQIENARLSILQQLTTEIHLSEQRIISAIVQQLQSNSNTTHLPYNTAQLPNNTNHLSNNATQLSNTITRSTSANASQPHNPASTEPITQPQTNRSSTTESAQPQETQQQDVRPNVPALKRVTASHRASPTPRAPSRTATNSPALQSSKLTTLKRTNTAQTKQSSLSTLKKSSSVNKPSPATPLSRTPTPTTQSQSSTPTPPTTTTPTTQVKHTVPNKPIPAVPVGVRSKNEKPTSTVNTKVKVSSAAVRKK